MNGRLIKKCEYKPMPWKNGLGTTEEIERRPGGDSYIWRLSRAPIVADGLFSLFPGYDRWICILEGNGVYLNGIKVNPLQPYRFSGDDPTECHLAGGKVFDLGLIFDRQRMNANMHFINEKTTLPRNIVHYLYDLKTENTSVFELDKTVEIETTGGVLVSLEKI